MKRRILFIIPHFYRSGGAERTLSLIVKELSNLYDISILTFHDNKKIYDFNGDYYSLNENKGLKKFLNHFKINEIVRPFNIYIKIRIISPDLILSFMDFANIPVILTKLIFRLKIPLIISIRANPKEEYKSNNKYMNFLIKLLYNLKKIEKIVTVSKKQQKLLEKYYKIKKSKFLTIYNGLDLAKIQELRNSPIKEFKNIFKDPNIIKFISVGRLSEEKGHIFLLESFKKVKKSGFDSKLVIIGNGPLKHSLEDYIRKWKLENDVYLLGFQKNPFKFLSEADIFILSSKHEGFPNALIEALACGIPVISTNCETGPIEILDNGKYGYLVNVNDVDNLADKMIFLIKNPEILKNFSRLAFERAKIFNIDKISEEWINLINSNI